MSTAIEFKSVWEGYRLKFIRQGRSAWEDFWALRDITLSVYEGEVLGIIGENGAGKTTILKLIAGLLQPDRGSVEVKGRVGGLLDITAGFQPELTGQENISLNAALFGLSSREIESRFDSIVAFSGLEKFIYAPLQCYSQGMLVRLAFATAIHSDPDILLIDDIFSVGDEDFQRRSLKKIYELKEARKTIVFVTHNMGLASGFSTRGIYLREGRIVEAASMEKAIACYMESFGSAEGIGILEKGRLRVIFNNGRLSISWEGTFLTKGFGSYALFNFRGGVYHSMGFSWKVEVKNETEMILCGESQIVPFVWKWRLCAESEDSLVLDCWLEADLDPESIQGFEVNVMFTDRYTIWRTLLDSEAFPAFEIMDERPKDIRRRQEDLKVVGLERDEKNSAWPALVVENLFEKKTRLKLKNSSYQDACRMVSVESFAHSAKSSLRFSFGMPDPELFLSRAQKDQILEKGNLKLVASKHGLKIYWKDSELTPWDGVFSSIQTPAGDWFDTKEGSWLMERQGEDRIIAKVEYCRGQVSESWDICLKSDKSVSFALSLKVVEGFDVHLHRLVFLMPFFPCEWMTHAESGSCPDLAPGREWYDILQKSVQGEFGLAYSGEADFCAFFEFKDRALEQYGKLYNVSLPYQARAFEIFSTFSGGSNRFLEKEEAKTIGCELSLLDKGSLEARFGGRNIVGGIGSLELDLELKNSVFHISSGGKRITKQMGLYSALRSSGRWLSTAQGSWTVEETEEHSIRARCDFPRIDLSQEWRMKIEEGQIHYEIDVICSGEFIVDRCQVNFMVSDDYGSWISSDGRTAAFPVFSGRSDDDWACFFSQESKEKTWIGLEASVDKPAVRFHGAAMNAPAMLSILNSDVYFRSRVLQAGWSGEVKLSQGRKPLFSGVLSFAKGGF